MTTIKIQRNIPIPNSHNSCSGLSRTLRAMEPGDCITLTLDKRSGLHSIAKGVGVKIITRTVKRAGTGGKALRVWKVAQ